MQQNGKIDGKLKIVNPIYYDENFAEDPLKIYGKTCNDKSYISEESVDAASINSKNENCSNDNYGDILSNKSFTDEHINSDDPNKTASDNEITINDIEHYLSNRITAVENLNAKRCDCMTKLEYLRDEFNLKAMSIKRNLVLKIENLKDEITSIRKDVNLNSIKI